MKKCVDFRFVCGDYHGVSLMDICTQKGGGDVVIYLWWSDGSQTDVMFDFDFAASLFGKRVVCGECGKRATYSCHEWANAEMAYTKLCRDCFFWIQKVAMQGVGARCLRINHEHYVASPPGSLMRGYGGRAFRYQMLDEPKVCETTNLWSQGAIPERFWDRLYDNAIFVAVDERPWSELADAKLSDS